MKKKNCKRVDNNWGKGIQNRKEKDCKCEKEIRIKERRNTLTEIWPKEKLVFDH
jgi:hypothetical protein